MMISFIEQMQTCSDAVSTFAYFFDTTIAPPLLFYSYIPILVISLLFGFTIYRNNKKSYVSKYFLGLTISFSLWIILIILQWVAIHVNVVHFAWQALIIFEFLIYMFSILLAYSLLYKKEPSEYLKNIFFFLILAISATIPTHLNISYFDLTNCEGGIGKAWYIEYIFEAISSVIILIFIINAKRKSRFTNSAPDILVSIGVIAFTVIFFLSNIFGEITKTYDINLMGPVGMLLLLILISGAILKYQAFNAKLFLTEILIGLQTFLIFALLFIENTFYIHLLVIITLLTTLPLGFYIIRSVKKEISQREKIEKLAEDLERANEKLRELDQMKSEFLSLATHQIRAPLTAIKGYSSMLLEGDFGILPVRAKDSVGTIMKSCQNLIDIVNDFLNISRIEQGRMVYEKTTFDLAELIKEVAKELEPNIKNAGLNLELHVPENFEAKVNADRGKIKQIVGNVIDNAIKYTPKGDINIKVFKEYGKAKVSVKDSGIGIPREEMSKLFNKFSRTKDAHKTNVIGTGLGLYIAKKMIEAQKGDIKVASDGQDKGAEFVIELPLEQ